MEAQEVVGALLESTRAVELAETPRLVPFATIRRVENGLCVRLVPR